MRPFACAGPHSAPACRRRERAAWRQRSEQYRTAGQQSRHFRRQANGRPQTGQTLNGKSDFLRMAAPGHVFLIYRLFFQKSLDYRVVKT
jgi:hypothetical protein